MGNKVDPFASAFLVQHFSCIVVRIAHSIVTEPLAYKAAYGKPLLVSADKGKYKPYKRGVFANITLKQPADRAVAYTWKALPHIHFVIVFSAFGILADPLFNYLFAVNLASLRNTCTLKRANFCFKHRHKSIHSYIIHTLLHSALNAKPAEFSAAFVYPVTIVYRRQGKITGFYSLRDLNRNAVSVAVPIHQPLKARPVSFLGISYTKRHPRLYNKGIRYIHIFAICLYNFIPPKNRMVELKGFRFVY